MQSYKNYEGKRMKEKRAKKEEFKENVVNSFITFFLSCVVSLFVIVILFNVYLYSCERYDFKTEEVVKRENNEEQIELVNLEASEKVNDSGFVYIEEIPMSEEWQKYTWELCEENGISPFLIYAIAEHESGFNADAIGVDGKDIGLMQIREVNHEWINERVGRELDYTNEFDSVLAAVTMISDLYEENNGDVNKTLMCYNMGSAGAKKAMSNGIKTTRYSTSIQEDIEKWETISNK